MKIAVDIADAVAAELSSLPITVHRRVLPEFELAELTEGGPGRGRRYHVQRPK